MIHVTPAITIDESEVQEDFVRATGPGGQNVNKVSTAVQLRFDVAKSPSLPAGVRDRLMSLARGRISGDGVLIITARRFRTQGANREDAVNRLVELVRKAAEEPPVRIRTRPTRASKARRLDSKHRRAQTKRLRSQRPGASDE